MQIRVVWAIDHEAFNTKACLTVRT